LTDLGSVHLPPLPHIILLACLRDCYDPVDRIFLGVG
jgi:hypothetical protein